MMRYTRFLSILAIAALAACAAPQPSRPLPTVRAVDLSRYTGTWYEQARLPMWFQRNCVASKAVYTARDSQMIGVHNECRTKSGGIEQADGVATVVAPDTQARLSVSFDNIFARWFGTPEWGNYWIIALDEAYETAMVGTPDRKFLWILARHPQIAPERLRELVERAGSLGFATERLVYHQHEAQAR